MRIAETPSRFSEVQRLQPMLNELAQLNRDPSLDLLYRNQRIVTLHHQTGDASELGQVQRDLAAHYLLTPEAPLPDVLLNIGNTCAVVCAMTLLRLTTIKKELSLLPTEQKEYERGIAGLAGSLALMAMASEDQGNIQLAAERCLPILEQSPHLTARLMVSQLRALGGQEAEVPTLAANASKLELIAGSQRARFEKRWKTALQDALKTEQLRRELLPRQELALTLKLIHRRNL